ncbi:MAG TPA: histidine kinase [Acidimicrobiales bacterium]|nr:histidine kinase [Acidimicrobiales bacterium]
MGVVLAACSAVPLVAWRRFPLGVFAMTTGASVLLAALDYPLDLALGSVAALYLLAASRGERVAWTRSVTVIVVGLVVAYLVVSAAARGSFPASALLHSGLAWAVAWFGGERSRLRHERIAQLSARVRRAEHEAEQERMLAVAEERARIARDLHDSAAHAINVIAVRAGAARLRHQQDPARSLTALEAIEELARQTAEEIDRIVGFLREDASANDGVEAPPGLASLDTLVAQHVAAGLDVMLDASGAPRALLGAADQAAFRVLQEALTNAARHGAGNARVQLAFDDAAVELTVTNSVPTRPSPRSGGGHGLIGMRERVSALGGDFEAGRVNGGFRVRARIPYRGGV